MRGSTHLLFGLILAAFFTEFFSYERPLLAVFLILLGSLLPDIDERHSKLGRNLPIISWFVKHRTFFHSLIFLVIVIITLSFYLEMIYVWSFAAGILGHYLLDIMTPQGLVPFWPAKVRIKGFIRTGSFFEKIIFVVFILVFLWLLFR